MLVPDSGLGPDVSLQKTGLQPRKDNYGFFCPWWEMRLSKKLTMSEISLCCWSVLLEKDLSIRLISPISISPHLSPQCWSLSWSNVESSNGTSQQISNNLAKAGIIISFLKLWFFIKCQKCVYFVHWLETLYIRFTDKWTKNTWLRCQFTLFIWVFSSAESINREGHSTEFQYQSAVIKIFAYILFLNSPFYLWKILRNFTNDIQQYRITRYIKTSLSL